MNITSVTQTQYASKSKNNQEINDPFKGQDYVLNTLDEDGNELLNQALTGKTDKEKWMLKLSLDMALSTEVKDGTVQKIADIDNSRQGTINSLESFIKEKNGINAPDMLGTGAIAEKLLETYKNSETSFNVENQESSVVDKFYNDLYSKESLSFSSSRIKDDINDKVTEKAMELFSTKADSPESILDINNELHKYKQILLEEYKLSIKDKDSTNLEKEAVIKVLLDETEKKVSPLEALLTKKVDNNKELTKHINIDEHKLETLDAAGNEALNQLLVGKTDKEKIEIKLVLDFNLMIKEVNVVNGELHLTYEKNTDPKVIKEKLDTLIHDMKKSPNSGSKGTQDVLRIFEGLRDFYT